MSIGNRLSAVIEILDSIGKSALFADVGSDHAYLAIEVMKRSLADAAIASDINELPLMKGRENAELQGVDLEFILSDGFDAFDGRDVTAAAICGMGGELIARIIERSGIARRAELILQPMSHQEHLREYLWSNGFEILREIFVTEADKHYTVMHARYLGTNSDYSYLDLYLGKERAKSDAFCAYCKKICESALKRRLGIVARGGDTEDIDGLIEFCQTQTTSF
ncbi:MAG: SAM-dependent methyltransferase [Clostridia bacterium]|nr:SAM-dependent methyltransferase [Clostridia bacterium]